MNYDDISIIKKREERLTSILDNIDVGLLLQGPSAEIFMSNEKAFELLGLTEDQLVGKTSFDPDWNVIREDGSTFSGEMHPVPQSIATKKSVKDVVMGVYRPSKGDRVWLLVNAIPILKDDGNIKHVVCSFIDISEEKKAKDQLKKSHSELSILYQVYKNTTENLNLKEIFNNALNTIKEAFLIDGIAIYTMEEDLKTLLFGASVGFSDKFIQEIQIVKSGEGLAGKSIILGVPQFADYKDYPDGKFKSLLVDQGFKSMGSIPMMIGNNAVGAISIAFMKDKKIQDDELKLLMAVSSQIAIAIQNAQLVKSLKNELLERCRAEEALLTANETITEKNLLLNQLMASLEIESKVDPLTGLYNRRFMLEKINDEISNFKRRLKKFSIIIADIDNYKTVNDTHGHDFGDYVLKIISELLKSSLREVDCLSRWGGDEFLMLLDETELDVAKLTMERIRLKIEENIFEYNNKKISLTMTFGISTYNDTESIDDVIKRADNALYIGKKNGRNCVFIAE